MADDQAVSRKRVWPIIQCNADAGYSSGENLKAVEQQKIGAYIPFRKYYA